MKSNSENVSPRPRAYLLFGGYTIWELNSNSEKAILRCGQTLLPELGGRFRNRTLAAERMQFRCPSTIRRSPMPRVGYLTPPRRRRPGRPGARDPSAPATSLHPGGSAACPGARDPSAPASSLHPGGSAACPGARDPSAPASSLQGGRGGTIHFP